MREIKFRAWDKWNQNFVYFNIDTPSNADIDGLSIFRKVKKEQYTGLKDRNGVEIYEYMEIDGNFEVSFKDGSYVLINISNGDIILLYNYLKDKNGQVTVTKEYTKI